MKKLLAGCFLLLSSTLIASAGVTSFTTNLSYGMTANANVEALQQFLTTQGVYTGPINGNFFSLTLQGVKKFQTEKDITPVSGYFGPITRAAANNALALNTKLNTNSISTSTSNETAVATSAANMLAYIQLQVNGMFQTVQGLQQKLFRHQSSTSSTHTANPPSPSIPTPTPAPTPTPTPAPTPIVNPTPTSTPTTSAPASTSMLWGAYVGDIDGTPSLVSSFGTLVGGSPNIIATFVDLSSGDFPSAEKTVVGNQGKTLLMFLEPQYSFDQLNSGKYDSILQQYASAAAAYGDPIILAPFDEFNLNENPWGYGVDGNTPAEFIQAWQHVHSFFANDPNVKFALVYNNVSEPATSANSYAAYYPGAAYVDYIAVDGFNFGTTSASAQTFEQIFGPIMPTLENFNKPILLTSIGSLEFPGKSQWITDGLGSYIKQYPNIAGWVYFNYDDTSAGQDWRVNTDPASLAAFQAVLP